MHFLDRVLDRKKPSDFEHVASYRYTVPRAVDHVEKILKLPSWHWSHDQGREGSCVGHGVAMERAITNTGQNLFTHLLHPGRRYNPLFIWNEAKKIDEWSDTNPGDDNGTSVRAAYDVCRDLGLTVVKSMALVSGVPIPIGEKPVDPAEGISVNRWATTVDEMRTAIATGIPVTIGVNWYSSFDVPRNKRIGRKNEWFIGDGDLGHIRGGHCVCTYGASDKYEAFRVKNSWGKDYPLVWLPYLTMQQLISEDGESALVTDR